MKILNLYSGIGGNRKLWGDEHEITAVEYDPQIAEVYQDFFPNDKVIVADAHQYLLNHFKEFDFIWSSPPCQTNSRVYEAGLKSDRYSNKHEHKYHDLSIYQQVLLLQRYFDGKYVVENVEPFYKPLIPARKIDRHLFWTNFIIGNFEPKNKKKPHEKAELDYLDSFFGFDIKYKFKNKLRRRQILRNCVHPETGRYILDCAMEVIRKEDTNQLDIFSQMDNL